LAAPVGLTAGGALASAKGAQFSGLPWPKLGIQ